jgi:hypothetical protein
VAYLIFTTQQEADDRSRAAWEQALGRQKRLQDVTEFLWESLVGKDGRTALTINDKEELLTAPELAAKVATLDGNW